MPAWPAPSAVLFGTRLLARSTTAALCASACIPEHVQTWAAYRHYHTPPARATTPRASLYAPAPPRALQQTGWPRVKGRRQPSLAQRLVDPLPVWDTLTVPRWSGAGARVIDVATGTAVRYHSGLPPVAMRWVLIRDPQGTFAPQALLCTALSASALQIVSWFVLRWQLEVTNHEVRAHLGVETQRQWSDLAILRTTPALRG